MITELRRKPDAGRAFTLVEVIVSLGVITLVVGAVWQLSGSGTRLFVQGTDKSLLLQAGQVALEKVAREIEQCQTITRAPRTYAASPGVEDEGPGLQVRLFVDPAGPDYATKAYECDRLVEYRSEASSVSGRWNLVREETGLDGSGGFPVVLLDGLLAEPARFRASPAGARSVKLRLLLVERDPNRSKFRGTVPLEKTVYLHSGS